MYKGLTGQFSYTWSHTLDVNTDSNGGGTPMNPYNWRADYGNSNWDIRHRVVATFVYDIPFFPQANAIVKTMFANWQANGIITIRSGLPFTVATGTDTANTASSGTYRPDLVKTPTADCGRGHLVGCIDPTAFTIATLYPANPNNYAYGNAGRNILFGPGSQEVNFSLAKNFPIASGSDSDSGSKLSVCLTIRIRKSAGDDQYVIVRKYHRSRSGHEIVTSSSEANCRSDRRSSSATRIQRSSRSFPSSAILGKMTRRAALQLPLGRGDRCRKRGNHTALYQRNLFHHLPQGPSPARVLRASEDSRVRRHRNGHRRRPAARHQPGRCPAYSRCGGKDRHSDCDLVGLRTASSKPAEPPNPAVRTRGVDAIRRALAIASDLNCGALLLYAVRLGNGPKLEVGSQDTWDRYSAELAEAVPEAERAKVFVDSENVWNKFLLSPLEMRAFVDRFHNPWAGVDF